ncbi:30S ribosomal protein S17 [Candidatus Microgenomates bacterium]|nr:30S ribosomal protein S17 [Candidatus Microgenomates bacterium]
MAKVFTGKVVSTKMSKTMVVEVVFARRHRLYKKIIRKKSRFKAHYENIEVKEGNMVKIVETRPLSGDKHFKLLEVIK